MEKESIKKMEVFFGYLGEAIFLAISLAIFSMLFKGEFFVNFLNNPIDWSNDYVIFFYILLLLGIIFLIIHAAFKTAIKFKK